MVLTVINYGLEFFIRVAIKLAFSIKDFLEREERKLIEEKKREELPRWWIQQDDEAGRSVLAWNGSLRVSIPTTHIQPNIPNVIYREKPPTRTYFTFKEAASKDFFKELERLVEKLSGGA